MIPIEERFWRKVDKNGPIPEHCQDLGSCWTWTGCRNRHGYGQIQMGRRGDGLWLAHRVSWVIAFGSDPGDLLVLHKCDNPACVNPAHLFLGTHADNARDMMAKGRGNPIGGHWLRGSDHPRSKLTESAVEKIRASSESLRACARRFGVSKKLILMVRQRKVWVHV